MMFASVRASEQAVPEFPLTNPRGLPTMRLAAETVESRATEERG